MPRLLADLTPLRASPEFRRLWWGLGISNVGTQLTAVAVGLQVYALTASTFAVGVLGLFALVPLIVLGLYGGALVDAFDRRRVALAASSVLLLVTIAIAAQAWLDVGSVWLLYVLVGLQSAASAVNNPARSAIMPRLVPAAAAARRAGVADAGLERRAHRRSAARCGPGRVALVRGRLHARRAAVRRRAVRAVAAARPAARGGARRRPVGSSGRRSGLGGGGPALPGHAPQPAHDVPSRPVSHDPGDATRGVPRRRRADPRRR